MQKSYFISGVKRRERDMNMIHFQRRFVAALACVAAGLGLSSCLSQIVGQAVRQQIKEAVGTDLAEVKDKQFRQMNSRAYTEFMQKVEQASSAKIWVRKGLRHGVTKDFALTQEEFVRLKQILQRTGAVPQARQKLLPMSVSRSYNKRLVLFDASGRQLYSVAYGNKWMKESQMKTLSVDRTAGLFDADWYLPDADYDAFFALPSLQAAESWAGSAR